MEFCQSAENLRRQHSLAAFIVSIGSLGDAYRLSQLFLREIAVLAKVTDSSIHRHHLNQAYLRTIYSIYILNKLFYNWDEVIILSYKELYLRLFAAITDALRDLQCGRIVSAIHILLRASEEAEAVHMERDILPDAPPE